MTEERGGNSIIYIDRKLCYVGQDCRNIPDVLGKLYGAVAESLDLSYNCLTNINGLRAFLRLKELILDNNSLDDTLKFPENVNLHTLSINNNKISNLDSFLAQLQKCKNLCYLSLLGNAACPNQLISSDKDEEDYQRYRYYVLHRLPWLKFLDSRPVTENERHEAAIRGKFMKVARPVDTSNVSEKRTLTLNYGPLPKVNRDSSNHQGVYCKRVRGYSSKHSEGNRFIRNNDL